VDQGLLYTIHGAIMADQLKQLYLHMETTADAIAPAKPPWWKRLFAARKPKTGDRCARCWGEEEWANEE